MQVVANGFGGTTAAALILYSVGLVDIYFDFKSHRWVSLLLAAYIGYVV